jgi:hypothetical protein
VVEGSIPFFRAQVLIVIDPMEGTEVKKRFAFLAVFAVAVTIALSGCSHGSYTRVDTRLMG